MSSQSRIRILVVDDSILFRKVLTDRLSANPRFEVIAAAVDANDAGRKILSLKPDVVTLDVEMPKKNGIELVKELMPVAPVPVVLVSALNISVFDALSAGAVDFVRKPEPGSPDGLNVFFDELAHKIIIASTANVHARFSAPPAREPEPGLPSSEQRIPSGGRSSSLVIALGASTGGTEATLEVLKTLPKNMPGMVVVQHMPPGFTKMYAERLDRLCQMEVKEAQSGDRIEPGRVLIAPGDMHMKVVRTGSGFSVNCYKGEKVSGHCPSVDVLFNSVAASVGRDAVGIIMTGMGRDGSSGLLNMRKKGAYTIGQDKASCVVYGMPMVAFDIGAVAVQAPCSRIASLLQSHVGKFA